MSRPVLIILAIAVIVLIILFATGFFSVKQTQEGALPTVDVSATGGQVPKYDVDSKKVVVGTTPTTVEVPKVETEKKTIDVPVVGVTDGNKD